MAKLLDIDGARADDRVLVGADAPAVVDEPALYPLAFWRDQRDALPGDAGVWVDVDVEPDALADVLDAVPLLAISFPAFSDGRGLSLAVLLRSRYGYRGEIRAVGAVHEDVVHYMHRCGFDSFVLDEERNTDVALRALTEPRDTYQGSIRDPKPAFRRIARA